MARRYSRILQAAYLNQAVDNYVQHIQTAATRQRNIGGGTPRAAQIDLAIDPFNTETDEGELWLARVGQPSRTFMQTAIGTAALEVGGATSAMRVPGYQPARLTLFVGTGTSTVATSAVTGLRYLKYNGTNYSHPFGRKTATDREQDVFLSLKAALPGTNRRYSLRSESIKQI